MTGGGSPGQQTSKGYHAPSAQWHASPNFGERRTGPIDILVLHYTGMPNAAGALEWLCNAASEVSSHYFVDEGGKIFQLVADQHRAWHAGKSSWSGETDINSRSIGIEIAHPGHFEQDGSLTSDPFPEPQIYSLIRLCHDICNRHKIPADRVLAHSDIAPGRKLDPGEMFPWHQLAEAGVGHYVEPQEITGGTFLSYGDQGQSVEALQELLMLYGYGIEKTGQFDARTRDVVVAFQRHFRPALVDGIADQSTVGTLHKLLSER